MKKQRLNNTFNLSFLDILFCGFGAVVLLVMVLNGKVLQKRVDTQKDLKAEVERVTKLKEYASEHLEELHKETETLELREADLMMEADQMRESIVEKEDQGKKNEEESEENKSEIEALEKEISKLKRQKEIYEQKEAKEVSKEKHVGFDGEGKRQYLTGLELGGERTLILIDASASMLDETIVNIIRRKYMDESVRRRSPKWVRAVKAVHWLIANLQPNKSFQVYSFNTDAQPVIHGTDEKWMNTNSAKDLDTAIAATRRLTPEGGTNLSSAFDVIKRMNPKPDSVLLLTDGLPTQGRFKPKGSTVTGKVRLSLFYSAVKDLPKGISINTLLFPIEGDPSAAGCFWELAILTDGSFMTPSRDWP